MSPYHLSRSPRGLAPGEGLGDRLVDEEAPGSPPEQNSTRYIYIYIYIYMYIYIYIYIEREREIDTYIYIYIYMHKHIYICIYVYMCIHDI